MNFKLARVQSGKTQSQIAHDLGMAQNTYSNYENGKTEPTIKNLIAIADYHNVSLDFLCGRQFNNQVGYIPDDKKEIVRIILQLNEVNTIKIFGFASGLLAGQN